MDFELTQGQKQAMEMVARLMKARPPMPAVITGFAGTGKTTMIKAIASQYGAPLILAPTGKAAVRVQEATGLEASTAHRWLYHPVENQDTGQIEFKRKPHALIDRPWNGLVVIDEGSMVGRDMWEDIWDVAMLLELRVILVGDTFQLPPVEGKRPDAEDWVPFQPLQDVDTEYRAHLSEITRQALDNPILRASMMIRESSNIAAPLGLLNRVFTKHFDDRCMEVFKAGGAIIVHKNDTRHRINHTVRTRLGYPEDQIVEGEPLLVLRNTYEIDRFNGEVVQFQGWQQYDGMQKAVADRWKAISLMLTFGKAKVDGQDVMLCPEQVRGAAQLMTESIIAKNSRFYYGDNYHDEEKDGALYSDPEGTGKKVYQGPPHLHCNFGYALTAHKSQGSEWGQVLVLVETSTRPTTYEGRRWLYTAITRAKEKVYFSTEV